MKKVILIIFLGFLLNPAFTQVQYDFAIYHDTETWFDGTVAFEQFLDWKGISHNRVSAQDINTVGLNQYSAICFPGGDADYYNADLNPVGIQNIKNLISNNGGYIGMCAGAEFACDELVWDGITYDYPLDLFQGQSIGPIDDLAVWPAYAITTVTMNLNEEINQYEPQNEDMLYWGGSIFNPDAGFEFDTLATYDAYYNEPAIIKFPYGNGRVLLSSPHPEIEEDSDRDSTTICQNLDDNGTDWNFLWTATDWVLGNTITQPASSLIVSQNATSPINIYPNPTKNWIRIEGQNIKQVAVLNQDGAVLMQVTNNFKQIDLSNLSAGLYFIEISMENHSVTEKLIVQ